MRALTTMLVALAFLTTFSLASDLAFASEGPTVATILQLYDSDEQNKSLALAYMAGVANSDMGWRIVISSWARGREAASDVSEDEAIAEILAKVTRCSERNIENVMVLMRQAAESGYDTATPAEIFLREHNDKACGKYTLK